MTQLLHWMRWESTILLRNQLLTISIAVTGIYIGLFQLLKMLPHHEEIALLLTLNDPALIGMLFVAVTILFERDSGSLQALVVTPMSVHAYLMAKLLSLSLLGTVCGWAMAAVLVGMHIHHLGFIMACFLVTWLFGCLGILLVAKCKRFVDFMLPMAGVLTLMCIPLLHWFGAVDMPFRWIFPLEHGIQLLAWAFRFQVADFPWPSFIVFLGVCAGAYAWAHSRFSHNIQ